MFEEDEEKRKLSKPERQNSWQQAKQTKLFSDLLTTQSTEEGIFKSSDSSAEGTLISPPTVPHCRTVISIIDNQHPWPLIFFFNADSYCKYFCTPPPPSFLWGDVIVVYAFRIFLNIFLVWKYCTVKGKRKKHTQLNAHICYTNRKFECFPALITGHGIGINLVLFHVCVCVRTRHTETQANIYTPTQSYSHAWILLHISMDACMQYHPTHTPGPLKDIPD